MALPVIALDHQPKTNASPLKQSSPYQCSGPEIEPRADAEGLRDVEWKVDDRRCSYSDSQLGDLEEQREGRLLRPPLRPQAPRQIPARVVLDSVLDI